MCYLELKTDVGRRQKTKLLKIDKVAIINFHSNVETIYCKLAKERMTL